LNDSGSIGWQGKLEELEYYQNAKKNNLPVRMLDVAENWLRKELIKNKELRKLEKAQGSVAYELDPTDRQGGYASGRGIMMKEVASAPLVKKGK